jgi:hypothetical protein
MKPRFAESFFPSGISCFFTFHFKGGGEWVKYNHIVGLMCAQRNLASL